MALDSNIVGGTSNIKADVDAANDLKVALPNNPIYVGSVRAFGENDPGTVADASLRYGTPYLKSPETSTDYRQRVGLDTLLFQYVFAAGTQNTGMWKHAFTTMTMVQSGGFLVSNNNLTGTAATGCSLSTWRYFSMVGTSSTYVEMTAAITATPQANQIFEAGLFVPTTTTVPADGVYYRITSAGIYGVVNYNGTESATLLTANPPAASINHNYVMSINDREVEFWIDDIFYGETAAPAGNAQIFITDSLPFSIQQRNSGLVSGSPQMQVKIGDVTLTQGDLHTAKPWSHQQASMGRAYQGLSGGTMGSNAIIANNQATAAAALTNTTAAVGSGLGGIYNILPTLTVNTDGIVTSFQNPAGSVTQPPRSLVITGIHIQSVVNVAFTGGPVAWVWMACWGQATVNLTTTTTDTGSFVTATAVAPRRLALGCEGLPVTATVGTVSSGGGIHVMLSSPIIVHPGQFFQIAAKNVGVVTSAGSVSTAIGIDHYFE